MSIDFPENGIIGKFENIYMANEHQTICDLQISSASDLTVVNLETKWSDAGFNLQVLSVI